MEQRTTFPLRTKPEESENPAIRIYGNRFHSDQTVYEYLIEFLLVFASAKTASGEGKLSFHTDTGTELSYFVEPRNGFRRFVFYEQAKKARRIPSDEDAYKEIRDVLKERVDTDSEEHKETFLNAARDLFYGYAVVLKKRSWCAQELLPLCPEMIFCEQMPIDATRAKGAEAWLKKNFVDGAYDGEATFADACFDYNRHNFLARGGEMYYLHLLQYLKDKQSEKETLGRLLNHLLTDKSAAFRKLASWIQETWEAERNIAPEFLIHKMPMGYIPAGAYADSGKCAAEELTNYLSNELHPVKRVEILAKGVMFQVMRMQAERTAGYLKTDRFPFIVDMRPAQGGAVIRKIAAQSFDALRDAFVEAIQKYLASDEIPDGKTEEEKRKYAYKLFVNARKESLDVFKGRGKELQCVIPSRGPYERFSLSEDVIRFLALSIVPPGEKMDMDAFLAELYRRYCLVIGPREYAQCARRSGLEEELTAAFQHNRDAFQDFLKAVGFLRDLSDATSIVVNPYEEVKLK